MQEATDVAPRKRPIWIWVIAAYFIFSHAFGYLSWYLISTGVIYVTPEQAAQFENVSTVEHVIGSIVAIFTLVGAILLIMLRKAAFYIFLTIFVIGLLRTLWEFFSLGFDTTIEPSGNVMTMLGYIILIGIYLYLWTLVRIGTLR